jgi:hypothetical protein
MKKIIITLTFVLISVLSFGQSVTMTINGAFADSSGTARNSLKLQGKDSTHILAYTKALIAAMGSISYMTHADMIASTPAYGTLVYQTDYSGGGYPGLFQYLDDDTWYPITISGHNANSSNDGWLTQGDWNTFNDKISTQWTTNSSQIYFNGWTAIGGTSASAQLHVMASSNNNYATIISNSNNSNTSHGLKIQCSTDAGNTSTNLIGFFDNDATVLGYIRWNGTTGSGSNVVLTAQSDARLKQNIHKTRFSIDTLMKINVVDFNWIDKPKGKLQTGVIAQELYKVYPNAVIKPEDETKDNWTLNREELIPLLVKSIQDQQAEITALTKRIENLEKKLK